MLLIPYANAEAPLVHGYIHPCGDLLNAVDSKNEAAKEQSYSYIMGYITGKNDAYVSTRGKNNSMDDLFYALVKFCRDNPLKDQWDGAREVYNNLK